MLSPLEIIAALPPAYFSTDSIDGFVKKFEKVGADNTLKLLHTIRDKTPYMHPELLPSVIYCLTETQKQLPLLLPTTMVLEAIMGMAASGDNPKMSKFKRALKTYQTDHMTIDALTLTCKQTYETRLAINNRLGPLKQSRDAELLDQKRKELSARVFAKHQDLGRLLDRHEGSLRSRWQRKKLGARTKTLRTACPTIPEEHRPDFRDFRKGMEHWQANQNNKLYRTPMININDLCRGDNLMQFINSRGRNAPHHFASADLTAVGLGLKLCRLKADDLSEYVMHLTGDSPESYGSVRVRNRLEQLPRSQCSPLFTTQEGWIVLEEQDTQLDFLLKCCIDIMSSSMVALLKYPLLIPEPSMPMPNSMTLGEHIVMSQYRSPHSIDWEDLINITLGEKDLGEDNIRRLRESPAYFFEQVQEEAQHDIHMVVDRKNNRPHPIVGTAEFSSLLTMRLVYRVYFFFGMWDVLGEALKICHKYKEDISSKPSELFVKSVQSARNLVKQYCNYLQLCLLNALIASPYLRDYFRREDDTDGSSRFRFHKLNQVDGPAWLLFLITTLVSIMKGKEEAMVLQDVLDEIEDMNGRDGQRTMISSYVACLLGHLNWLCYLQRELTSIPIIPPSDSMICFPSGDAADGMKRLHDLEQLFNLDGCKSGMSRLKARAVDVGILRAEDFVNFSERPGREDATSTAALDKTWGLYDTYYSSSTKEKLTLIGHFHRRFENGPDVDETEDDTAHQSSNTKSEVIIPEQTPTLVAQVSDPHRLSDVEKPSLEVQHLEISYGPPQLISASDILPAENQHVSYNEVIKPKDDEEEGFDLLAYIPELDPSNRWEVKLAKRYGRGKGMRWRSVPMTTYNFDEDDLGFPKELSESSYHTLAALLYDPSHNNQAGELPWVDVLHLMVELGFRYTDVGGSRYSFKHSIARNILSHSPHPESKYCQNDIYKLGRRLKYTYGLSLDQFSIK